MFRFVIAIAVSFVFSSLSLIHVYWAFGGSWATDVNVPEFEGKLVFKPGKLLTLGVACMLFVAAVLVAIEAKLLVVSIGALVWLSHIGTWGVAVVMLLRFIGDGRYFGILKRVRTTRFARLDAWFYSPLCLLLAISCIAVLL